MGFIFFGGGKRGTRPELYRGSLVFDAVNAALPRHRTDIGNDLSVPLGVRRNSQGRRSGIRSNTGSSRRSVEIGAASRFALFKR